MNLRSSFKDITYVKKKNSTLIPKNKDHNKKKVFNDLVSTEIFGKVMSAIILYFSERPLVTSFYFLLFFLFQKNHNWLMHDIILLCIEISNIQLYVAKSLFLQSYWFILNYNNFAYVFSKLVNQINVNIMKENGTKNWYRGDSFSPLPSIIPFFAPPIHHF